MRVINFSAGPALLPEAVLRRAADEMLDWHGSGMSVMEMSHRGAEFTGIAQKAEADFRRLLRIPDHFKVLFLQGGAMAMNAVIPMNLLGKNSRAAYVNTGEWSKKSISEAYKYGEVDVLASSEDRQFTYVPPQSAWKSHAGAAYVHVCTNETIGGVEYHWVPDTGDVPLVADMSSHILSREIDVSKYGVIYGGAQKNIGPAGLTFVIVREDLLDRALPITPSVFHWKAQAEADSMVNTPYLSFCKMPHLIQLSLKVRNATACASSKDIASSAACAPRSTTLCPLTVSVSWWITCESLSVPAPERDLICTCGIKPAMRPLALFWGDSLVDDAGV
jgi:phosphoserine aminotransferase